MRSLAPIIEAYELVLNPAPPMAIAADPNALFLINSLLFVILFSI
jgi:hypothetical protein